jgi:mannosylglycerate hydrolase
MENDYLKVSIARNGTLDVVDKTTQRTFKGLHYFADGGDAGTPWFYIRPAEDRVVTTLDAEADIRLVEDKPLAAVYRVEVSMNAPESLAPDKKTRVRKERRIAIVSHLRLTSESRYLEIASRVDTPVRDHRLRVKFPSGIETDFADAEGSFDLLRRPVAWDREKAKEWIDKEVGIQPQQSFVDLSDGKAGLGILNRGLRDYEVEQDDERTIALTLLRGVRYPKIAGGASPWADDPTPEKCQCVGEWDFHYAIYPHSGDWNTGRLYEEARRFNVPLNLAQCSPGLRIVEPEMSFVEISPRTLILSALKVSEAGNSLILRLFNPTTRKISGTISSAKEIKRARLVNLNEEPLPEGELEPRDGHRLDLEVPHKKIVTLELFVKR